MPTSPKLNENDTRIRALTSDQNLLRLVKRIAVAYGDDNVRLLSAREVDKVSELRDIDAVNKVIANVPQMSAGQRLDFCDAFVGENMSGLDLATPAILGGAYRAIASRARDGETGQQERLDKIAARIDDLSADFANSGGMVVSQKEWPLVDTNNIADVYEGFANMLDARMADIDATKNPEKYSEMQADLKQIETVVSDYDNVWGLKKLRGENAEKLAERWDEIYRALNRAELSEETKERLAKYKFLDNKDEIIPQFVSGKRGDTEKYTEYEPGFRIAKDGRLASVVELARHDVAKKHVADFETDIDEDALEIELNDEVLTKLFEIDAADKIVQNATENPELFTDPKYRTEFIERLAREGGQISDTGYNAAIDAQTNATAGWAARVKNKLGTASKKIGGFFGKVFEPIKHIDKMADVRMTRRSISKREKRIELFTRILKGFASAAIASALITTIATAAAAVAGVSVAMTLAAISIVTAIGMGVIQVTRWRKAQQAAGRSTDINEFLKDKRLVASLGASLLAVVAMCFGAAGLAVAAKSLGIGALTIGGANNAVSAYRDARDARMSVAESIAWAIANAGAVVAGGFTGRALAHMGINAYNNANPRNTVFQNETTRVESQETPTTREITETRVEYTKDALDNAERIARMWYRDNPDILQQRVDAINAYNVEHGTNIDPYRAIMINGDAGGRTFDNMRLHINNSRIDPNINDVYSHGQHRVLTDAWGRANGFTHEELNAARHLFARDGSINSAGMDAVAKLDNMISDTNTVGYVDNRPVHTDNYFKPNDPKGWTTYTGGNAPKVENTYTTTETVTTTKPVEYIDYTPTKGDGVAMFGNYTPRARRTQLRDRLGSFVDRVRRGLRQGELTKEETPVREPEPTDMGEPIVPPVEPKEEEFIPVKEEPENQDIFTLPVKEETDVLPTFDLTEEDDSRDERLDEPVRPVTPNKDIDGVLRRLREAQQQRLLKPGKTPVALLNPGKPKKTPVHGPSFAITYTQAKKWDDLHANLDRVQIKLQKSSLGASDAAKLRTQEKDIIHDIEHLYNQIGRPSMDELGDALADAYRREYKKHMAEKPDDTDRRTPHRIIREWNEKHDSLLNKFETYGWNTSLDEADLYFPTPVMGIQTQKQSEREAMRAAAIRAEQERKEAARIAELKRQEAERLRQEAELLKQKTIEGALENAYSKSVHDPEGSHFVPENLIRLAKNPDVMFEPLMEIRGVPVKLVDLNGHNNPFTQNEGRAMVVVDIDGLRLPFYLANGNEPSGLETPGKWYPAFTILRNGKWIFNRTAEYFNDKSKEMGRIKEMARTLDAWIGDIRNYGTPTIGGVDNIAQVDPNHVYNLVDHIPNNITHYMIWATDLGINMASADIPWIKWYIRRVQSNDYDERTERKQKRQAARTEFRQRLEDGFADIRDRLRGRFGFGEKPHEKE